MHIFVLIFKNGQTIFNLSEWISFSQRPDLEYFIVKNGNDLEWKSWSCNCNSYSCSLPIKEKINVSEKARFKETAL